MITTAWPAVAEILRKARLRVTAVGTVLDGSVDSRVRAIGGGLRQPDRHSLVSRFQGREMRFQFLFLRPEVFQRHVGCDMGAM